MSLINRAYWRLRTQLDRRELRAEFAHLQFGALALQKLIDEFEFNTVLDLGSGQGLHSDCFAAHGKAVTALDYGDSIPFRQATNQSRVMIGDYLEIEFDHQLDCIWACHVLEHQLNVQEFLEKIRSDTREGGVVAITVPPLKHQVVGGHLSLWNAGLLIYRMVLAGFDMTDASVRRYGYNVSAIVRKRSIDIPELTFGFEDLQILGSFFPAEIQREIGSGGGFGGNLRKLNW